MALLLNCFKRLFSLRVCLLLFFVETRLVAKNTPFEQPRQAPKAYDKYIIAFKESEAKKHNNFEMIEKKIFQRFYSKFSGQSSIRKFKALITIKGLEKKKWRSFVESKLETSENLSHVSFFELEVDSNRQGRLDLESLKRDPNFLFVEEDSNNFLQGKREKEEIRSADVLAKFSTDSFFWWQEQLKLPQLLNDWKQSKELLGRKLTRPLIAVLDSGLDYKHSSFSKSNLWQNPTPGELACGHDLYGCDTTEPKEDKLGTGEIFPFGTKSVSGICLKHHSNCAHGTQVASLIVGHEQDSFGSGLCPHCRLLILKVVGEKNGEVTLFDSSIIRALKYIALVSKSNNDPVRLINLSFGKYQKSKAIELMLFYLRQEYNILTIAAAGNESSSKKFYPAALPNVVAVAASDSSRNLASYSNRGFWVDLVAPGGSLLQPMSVAMPGGSYDYAKGTSLAAPVVTGFAGLLLSIEPNLKADTLERLLLDPKGLDSNSALNTQVKIHSLLHGDYHKLSESKKRRIEPLCGQIVGFSSSNKFHLKSLLVWFILLIPILFIMLVRPHEVKL